MEEKLITIPLVAHDAECEHHLKLIKALVAFAAAEAFAIAAIAAVALF